MPSRSLLSRGPLQLFFRQKQFPDAARIAMKIQDTERIARVYAACTDDAVKKQVSFILGKQLYSFDAGDESLNELVRVGGELVVCVCVYRCMHTCRCA